MKSALIEFTLGIVIILLGIPVYFTVNDYLGGALFGIGAFFELLFISRGLSKILAKVLDHKKRV